MAHAIDVGQWLIENKSRGIGAVACQKLTYFSQVWSLVWYGTPIVDDEFEAWPMGPVSYELFRGHQKAQPGPIPGADPSRLSIEEQEIIRSVASHYGKYTGTALSQISHDQAWRAARGDAGPTDRLNTPVDMKLAVREYTRKSITSTDVPQLPMFGPLQRFSRDQILSEARTQHTRWQVVHDRLASA